MDVTYLMRQNVTSAGRLNVSTPCAYRENLMDVT